MSAHSGAGACQTTALSLLVTSLMQAFRAILTALLALLFVVSTNLCAIAAAFPGEIEECCEHEQAPGNSEHGLPCNGKECAPCLTLESGVNLAALAPFVVPAPVWTEDHDFAEFMRRMVAAAIQEVPAPPPNAEQIPSPPWFDVMKKAQPVRGPSHVA